MDLNPFLKDKIKTDFFIRHAITKGWGMQDYHFHDGFEINFPLTENIKWFVGDRIYTVKKGDLFLFNPMDLHKAIIHPDALYERYILFFKPEYLYSMSTSETDLLACFHDREASFSHGINISEEQTQPLFALFEKAIFYQENKVFGHDVYKKIILTEILLLVNSYYRSSRPSYVHRHDEGYKKIKPVIQFIHRNLSSDLSLDTLSKNFYMSKYHLGTVFKRATGLTINEYIINLRIMTARELLKNDLPVSLVGERVGFYNVSHFIRTFKKLTGFSPKQYVKNYT